METVASVPRPTPSMGGGTYSDVVIWLLGSAYIASPPPWRDKEINRLFGCTSLGAFSRAHRQRRSASLKHAMDET
jgi:hypothetical protein